MKPTKLTIIIDWDLPTLKKCYAHNFGDSDWRKVKKSDIAMWAASLAQADIESDLDAAMSVFHKKQILSDD